MKSVKLLRFAISCILMLSMFVPCVSAQDEPLKDQVKCYTTWDDYYFYVAVSVDCPDIRATHSTPNAEVTGDDCVSVFIDTANRRSDAIEPTCFAMTVSPAGGAQFLAGNDLGSLEAKPVWTFKYGNSVQGTINNSDDIDQGYSVEMAIPWSEMNVEKFSLGRMMDFNFVVHRHGDKSGDFVSLSPDIKTEADIMNPSKWSRIVFAKYSFGVATTNWDKILSAQYISRAPLINGTIADKEWHKNTAYSIDIPVPEGYVYEAKFPVQPLVFAAYHYNYQADKRKSAPLLGISKPDGCPALVDFPAKNAGPWFSYDRAQWHKEELSDMVAAGIDVVAPVYCGDADSRAGYADKGLDCLVSALEELRAEGKPYPKVAMLLDAKTLQPPPYVDSDIDVIGALYGSINSFFCRVPQDYWATAQTEKPDAGKIGPIVVLDPLLTNEEWAMPHCRERFEKDFGCPLVYANGSIDIVTPGKDFSSEKADMISRQNGETYNGAWQSATEKKALWVLCDSWNGFFNGTDICASRQYDGKYIDATSSNIRRFHGNKDFDAQYLSAKVPSVIGPRQISQAEFEIKNVGNLPWRASDGYALAYRWYKTGRYYCESKVRVPLGRDVMPGETVTVDIGIASVKEKGAAIPDGNWELRFEIVRTSDGKWFSALGDQPLVIPITVGAVPELAAGWLTCRGPIMMTCGHDYPMVIRVRNDGSREWPRGTKLECRLYKTSDELDEEVSIKSIRAVLDKQCLPGDIAEFSFDLNLLGADKKPLPSWKQDNNWSYQLRFDLFDGNNRLSESGGRTLNRMIDIFETDYGPRIVDCDIPRKLTAGQTVDVRIVVRNNGVQTWDRKRTKIGYHWYYLDGTEMLWNGPTVPITQNIEPGWPVIIPAQVTAPDYDGQYVLVWDVMIDDQWLSTGPLSRGGDILPVFVEVTNGKLEFVDLSGVCDVQLSSPDTDRTAGDFDGKGSSFPTELLPPDAGLTQEVKRVYPTGYNLNRDDQPEGRISFLYPDKTPGNPGAVACNRQKIALEQQAYATLHILGASTNNDAAGDITLDYSKGPQTISITMSDWGKGPSRDEKIAYRVRHRHTHGGDEIGTPCYLYDYSIPLDPSQTISSITLPGNTDMKIVAITLERVEMPKAVGEGLED